MEKYNIFEDVFISEDFIKDKEKQIKLAEYIKQLDEGVQAVVQMYMCEKVDIAEIADRMGISEDEVNNMINKFKKDIIEFIGEEKKEDKRYVSMVSFPIVSLIMMNKLSDWISENVVDGVIKGSVEMTDAGSVVSGTQTMVSGTGSQVMGGESVAKAAQSVEAAAQPVEAVSQPAEAAQSAEAVSQPAEMVQSVETAAQPQPAVNPAGNIASNAAKTAVKATAKTGISTGAKVAIAVIATTAVVATGVVATKVINQDNTENVSSSETYTGIIAGKAGGFSSPEETTVMAESTNDVYKVMSDEFDSVVKSYGTTNIVFRDGKAGVIDNEGKILIPYEYDYAVGNLQDDCFALGKKIDETHAMYYLYDKNMNVIYQTKDYENYKIVSYNENILQLVNASDVKDNIYLDKDQNWKKVVEINADKYPDIKSAGNCSNGVILIKYVAENIHPQSDIVTGVKKDGTEFKYMIEGGLNSYSINCSASEESSNDCSISSDGYFVNYSGFHVDSNGQMNTGTFVYNINTGKNVYLSSGGTWHKIGVEGNSNIGSSVGNGLIVINDQYTGGDTSSRIYKVYSAETGKIVSGDQLFGYVDVSDYGKNLMLALDINGKWGYVGTDFKLTKVYDDATSYGNGYAVVKENDSFYIIDPNGNKKSELKELKGCKSIYLASESTNSKVNVYSVEESNGKRKILIIDTSKIK